MFGIHSKGVIATFGKLVKKEAKAEAKAEKADTKAEKAETDAERKETDYRTRFLAEGRYINDLEGLRLKKATVHKAVEAGVSAWTHVQNQKKALMGKVTTGLIQVRNLYARATSSGAAIIDPGFQSKLKLWKGEQANLLEAIEKQVQLQIAENRADHERWKKVYVMISTQIKAVMKYLNFLKKQRKDVDLILRDIETEIRAETTQLREEVMQAGLAAHEKEKQRTAA